MIYRYLEQSDQPVTVAHTFPTIRYSLATLCALAVIATCVVSYVVWYKAPMTARIILVIPATIVTILVSLLLCRSYLRYVDSRKPTDIVNMHTLDQKTTSAEPTGFFNMNALSTDSAANISDPPLPPSMTDLPPLI